MIFPAKRNTPVMTTSIGTSANRCESLAGENSNPQLLRADMRNQAKADFPMPQQAGVIPQ